MIFKGTFGIKDQTISLSECIAKVSGWKILVQAYIGYGGIWRDMEGMVIIVYMPQMKKVMFWCLCEHPRPLPVLGAIPYIM